jgi:hypothetical protein
MTITYLSKIYFLQANTTALANNASFANIPANPATDPADKSANGNISIKTGVSGGFPEFFGDKPLIGTTTMGLFEVLQTKLLLLLRTRHIIECRQVIDSHSIRLGFNQITGSIQYRPGPDLESGDNQGWRGEVLKSSLD